jgi:hypothetical protein
MPGLHLREEFQGKRLKGTAIELSNDGKTGAIQISAQAGSRESQPLGGRHFTHSGAPRGARQTQRNWRKCSKNCRPAAKALGLSSRTQLENNAGGASHAFQPARTESLNLPWTDCAQQIDAAPNWLFWHHRPDAQMHDEAGAGQGLDALTRDAARELSSDAFWAFVERLATGRRLVITSDHGYAATSLFPDAEGEIATFLKKAFSSGRFTDRSTNCGPFAPPVALPLHNAHGGHLLALGRRKCKSQGGYPTLAHGGMTLLEVLSPFLEVSKTGG